MPNKKEAIMKKQIMTLTLALCAAAGNAFAGFGTSVAGDGLIGKVFLAFLAAIVVFQLLPGLALFGSMLKGMFRQTPESESR